MRVELKFQPSIFLTAQPACLGVPVFRTCLRGMGRNRFWHSCRVDATQANSRRWDCAARDLLCAEDPNTYGGTILMKPA